MKKHYLIALIFLLCIPLALSFNPVNWIINIINPTQAAHLDSNRLFQEDIFSIIQYKDDNYAYIPSGDYIRVTFEQLLDNSKDITVYAKGNGTIEIYKEGSNNKVTEIIINGENSYKKFLTYLIGEEDVFDLKIIGNIEIDFITDPLSTNCDQIPTGTGQGCGFYMNNNTCIDTTGGDHSLTATDTCWKYQECIDYLGISCDYWNGGAQTQGVCARDGVGGGTCAGFGVVSGEYGTGIQGGSAPNFHSGNENSSCMSLAGDLMICSSTGGYSPSPDSLCIGMACSSGTTAAFNCSDNVCSVSDISPTTTSSTCYGGWACDSSVNGSGWAQNGICSQNGPPPLSCQTSGYICLAWSTYYQDSCAMSCSNGDPCDATLTDGIFNASYGTCQGGSCVAAGIDATPPDINIISPLDWMTPYYYYTHFIAFNVSISENASWCGYSLDGAANVSLTALNVTYWYKNADVANGSHTIQYSCNDTSGNWNRTLVRTFVEAYNMTCASAADCASYNPPLDICLDTSGNNVPDSCNDESVDCFNWVGKSCNVGATQSVCTQQGICAATTIVSGEYGVYLSGGTSIDFHSGNENNTCDSSNDMQACTTPTYTPTDTGVCVNNACTSYSPVLFNCTDTLCEVSEIAPTKLSTICGGSTAGWACDSSTTSQWIQDSICDGTTCQTAGYICYDPSTFMWATNCGVTCGNGDPCDATLTNGNFDTAYGTCQEGNCILTSPPSVTFKNNTLSNNAYTSNNYTVSNISINIQTGAVILDLMYEWNYTNYTLYNYSVRAMFNFENRSALGEDDSKAVDISQFGNNATCGGVNCPILNQTGRYGTGYAFDGTDDYFNISASLHDGQYTISAWVYPVGGITAGKNEMTIATDVNSNTYYFILSGRSLFGYGTGWGIGWFSGGWQGTSTGDTVASQLNKWSHVTGTYNGSLFSIYVNGKLINTHQASLSGSAGTLGRIGYYSDAFTEPFNGTIDELRFYNRSLPAKEVYELYVSNLQKFNSSYWVFYANQSNNTDNGLERNSYTYQAYVKDSFNNWGNTGKRTIYAGDWTAPSINFSSPTPSNGTSISENYAIINITIKDNMDLGDVRFNWNGNNYTIYNTSVVLLYSFENRSAFGENTTYVFDMSNSKNNGVIVDGGNINSTGGRYGLGFNADGSGDGITVSNMPDLSTYALESWIKPEETNNYDNLFYWTTTNTYVALYNGVCSYTSGWSCTSTAPTVGIWSHLVILSNGTVFLNGVDIGGITMEAVSGVLSIMDRDGSASDYAGRMDEIRVWNTTLTAQQVGELYNSNLQRFNSTYLELRVNQTNLGIGAHTYQAFAADEYNLYTAIVIGNSNNTELMNLNSGSDITSPTFSNNQDNSTYLYPTNGSTIQLNLSINDSSNISFYRLAVNETGVWVNQTIQSATGNVSAIFNFTLTNFSIMGGTLGWKVWANDTEGNVGESSIFTLDVKATCGTLGIAGNYILTSNATGSGTCYTIRSDNASLNCKGFAINYKTGGANSQYGIDDSGGYDNLTITNCNIIAKSANGNLGYGIYLSGVINSNISNNNITTNGTNDNYGIYLKTNSNGNNISSNIIRSGGSSLNNFGIYLSASSSNTIHNNTIITVGGGSGDADGIRLISSSANNEIKYNSITTNGTTNNFGIIFLTGSNLNNIFYNRVNTGGTSNYNYGVYLDASANNVFIGNNISVSGDGKDHDVFYISGDSDNCQFTNNTLNAVGNVSEGFYLIASGGQTPNNNTFTSNKINEITGNDWYLANQDIDNNYLINQHIRNYTIASTGSKFSIANLSVGKIQFFSVVTGTGSNLYGNSTSDIKLLNNSIIVQNSIFNVSANLTLYNMNDWSLTNPSILRDGTACGNDCYNFTSLAVATVKFNVTRWSNYSLSGGSSDSIYPSYSNFINNGSVYTKYGNIVNWSVILSDDNEIDGYKFAHNMTGTLTNGSFIEGNYTYVNTTLTITKNRGNYLCGQYWFNDTSNNVNQTNLSCFSVINSEPTFSGFNLSNSVIRSTNQSINGSCTDIDGDALRYVWFMDTNNPPTTLVQSGAVSAYLTAMDQETTYYYYVNCSDSFLNTTSGVQNIELDVQSPEISSTVPNEFNLSRFNSRLVQVNISIFDPNGNLWKYAINISDGTNNETANYTMSPLIYYYNDTATYDLTNLSEGTIYFKLEAIDALSHSPNRPGRKIKVTNSSNGVETISSGSKLITPKTTTTTYTDDTYGLECNSTLELLNPAEKPISINGRNVVYNLTNDGKHIDEGVCIDLNNGQIIVRTVRCNQQIELINASAGHANIKQSLTYFTHYSDVLAGYTVNSSLVNNVFTTNLKSSWGNERVCFNSMLSGGLNSAEITYTGILDVTPPTYSNFQNNGSTSTKYGNIVNWSIILADNLNISGYKFAHNQTGTLTNGTYNYGNYTAISELLSITKTKGNYLCGQYWFNDSVGNQNQTNLSCFSVANTVPLTPTILSPYNNELNNTRKIEFTSSDADGNTLTYKVYINSTLNFSTTGNISIWNGSDGTYVLNISVTDSFDSSTNATAIFTLDTIAPTVNITYPSNNSVINSSPVDLNGTGVDIRTQSLIYYWVINGTTNTSTVNASSTFNGGSGYYNLTLKVSDGLQNGSYTVFFTVNVVTSETPSGSGGASSTSSGSTAASSPVTQQQKLSAASCNTNPSLFNRIFNGFAGIPSCKVADDGVCNDGEWLLLDKDCKFDDTVPYSMWFIRFILILTLWFFINKDDKFPLFVILSIGLLIMNGLFASSTSTFALPSFAPMWDYIKSKPELKLILLGISAYIFIKFTNNK